MFKKISVMAAASLLSLSANANWVGGVSYINVSDDTDGVDISVGVVAGSLGYEFKQSDQFSIVPELKLGFGVGDDNLFGAEVSVKTLTSLSVRGEYLLNENFYIYAAPSYVNLDIEAKANGNTASEDAWEFGVGGGLGYQVSDSTSAEISYETFDGTDFISAALRFAF